MVEPEFTTREWSDRIRRLLNDHKLTQAALAERLGVSPATVSRWIAGKNEPTAETYVALGNLAGRPEGNYFWERAGIDTSELPDPSLRQALSSLRVSLDNFNLIASKKASQELQGRGNAVAIPLMSVTAYGDRVPPQNQENYKDCPKHGVSPVKRHLCDVVAGTGVAIGHNGSRGNWSFE